MIMLSDSRACCAAVSTVPAAATIKQISSPAYELAETTTGRLSKVTYAEFVQLAIISTTVA
jgi:hypothetical protein